ncbi:MAG: NAD(P)H-dependent oxidoreductase [Micropruina sp.]|uniref:NADPH-dependent FMN reductase n=1 Tax=Micropruina sp. TaxID=2737536 RepID=UPI0039E25C9D
MSNPTLQVIVASTRPRRVGRMVADYIGERLADHGGFDIEMVDLAEVSLPLLDEPHHPRLGRYEHEHTKAWSATISRGDAYLIVMPEYNHSFSAPLKNALDYLNTEWRGKPVAVASYGGISGGTRAAAAITEVLVTLGMIVSSVGIAIPMVQSHLADGRFTGYPQADHTIEATHAALLELTHGRNAG